MGTTKIHAPTQKNTKQADGGSRSGGETYNQQEAELGAGGNYGSDPVPEGGRSLLSSRAPCLGPLMLVARDAITWDVFVTRQSIAWDETLTLGEGDAGLIRNDDLCGCT